MFLRLLLVLFFCVSCSSLYSLKDNPTAQELFDHATKLKNELYYKEALNYFKQVKSQFIYSRFAKKADLAIADIYFAQEEWKKAIIAYKHFYERYPQNSKADHAVFYLALSYFHQLPVTEDRDLSFSDKALLYLNKHLKLFPKSPYRASAKAYKRKVFLLLAKREWMIARFHIHQDKPGSALPYLATLIKDYSFLLPATEKEKRSHITAQTKLQDTYDDEDFEDNETRKNIADKQKSKTKKPISKKQTAKIKGLKSFKDSSKNFDPGLPSLEKLKQLTANLKLKVKQEKAS